MRISSENNICQYPAHEINASGKSYDKELLHKLKATSLSFLELAKFAWQAENPSAALLSFDCKATDASYIHNADKLFDLLYKTTGKSFYAEAKVAFYLRLMYETESGRRMLNFAVEQGETWDLQVTEHFQSDMVNQVTGIPDKYDFPLSGYPEIQFYFHELSHRCAGFLEKDGAHPAGPVCLLVNRTIAELIISEKIDVKALEHSLIFRTEYENIELCDGHIQYMYKIDKSKILTDEEIKNNSYALERTPTERKVYIENATRVRNELQEKLNRERKDKIAGEAFRQFKFAEDMYRLNVEKNYKKNLDQRQEIEKKNDERIKYESRERRADFNVLNNIALPSVTLTHMIYDSFDALFGSVNITSIESLILEGKLMSKMDVPVLQAEPIRIKSLAEQVTELIEQVRILRNTDPEKALALVNENIEILTNVQKRVQEDANRIKEINNQISNMENGEAQKNDLIGIAYPAIEPAPPEAPKKTEKKVVKIESDKEKIQKRGFIFPPHVGDDTTNNVIMHNVKNVMNNKDPYVVFLKSQSDLDKFNKDKDTIKKEYKASLIQEEKKSKSKGKTKTSHDINFAKGVLSTIDKTKATIGNGERPLHKLNVAETKLYINGHGEAGTDGIFHKVGDNYVKTTSDEIVKMLKEKGLPMDYQDVRLLACHTASSKKIESFDDTELAKSEKDRKVTKKNMDEIITKIPAVKAFAENMYKNGYEHSRVTGYYGKGKVKPQVKKGGGYYASQEAETGKPERRSQYKVKYGMQTVK